MDIYFIRHNEIGLRVIMPADGENFLRWHNDKATRERIGGIFPFNNELFRKICSSYGEQQPSDIWFAITKNDELVGIAGLHSVKYYQRNAEIAILIGEEGHRRKGVGREAIELIVEYAFGTLALHRLFALVYADNTPAIHFFNTIGWSKEGLLKEASYWNYGFRDIVVWAKINHGG